MKTSSFFALAVSAIIMIGLAASVVRRSRAGGSAPPPLDSTVSARTGSVQTTAALAAQPQIAAAFGKLPLSFEANRGQTDSRVKFLSRGRGYGLFLTSTEAILTLSPTTEADVSSPASARSQAAGDLTPVRTKRDSAAQSTASLRMSLAGSNPTAHVTGFEKLPGKANYFLGNDPKKWHTNVPTYAKVKYENIYPGVDLVYYGNQQDLESDFVIAPGADPRVIRLKFHGTRSIKTNHEGDLLVRLQNGEAILRKPVAYQWTSNNKLPANDSGKHFVTARYVLENRREVSFAVGAYDAREPLIIDPVLVYSTYLGGSSNDFGNAIAVDANGNAYVTGYTTSTDFPTATPIQPSYHPSGQNCVNYRFPGGIVYPCPDAFVTKLNAAGTAVLYSTYLGGSNRDVASGIAVDSSGNAYVTGSTRSADFPTMNPFQSTCASCANGYDDAFVAKINGSGDALVFSTYLGGNGQDGANGIAIDSSGSAYVTGITVSSDFPTTPGAYDITCGTDGACNPGAFGGKYEDAFVAKFDPSGAKLLYSTYLGGSSDDAASGIAVDTSGNAYVTGDTYSSDFPTTPGAYDTTCGTDGACNPNALGQLQADSFVAKLDPTGSKLVYSTYLGGSGSDNGTAIAVDASGSAYVTGDTASTDFPTQNALQAVLTGNGDAFVTKLDPAGSALVYSTYLGGSSGAGASGIAVDSSGDAYVTGETASNDFPISSPVQATLSGLGDSFVTKLDPTGSKLLYSTYFGGSGYAIAIDASGNAFVTGSTMSNFVTLGSFMTAAHGGLCLGQSPVTANPPCSDAFVAKISLADAPGFAVAPPGLNFGAQAVSTSASQNINLLDAGSQPLTITSITLSGTNPGDFSDTTTCALSPATVAGGGNCPVSVTFSPQTLGTKSATLVVTDDAAGSPHSIALTGISVTPPTAVLSASSLAFGSVLIGSSSTPQTITVTNTGGAPLQISSASLTAGFQLQGAGSGVVNCDLPPVIVNGGATCDYAVLFVPQVAGPVTGTLSFVDNAVNTPQTIALSGTGQDFSLSSNSTSATITAGQTATFMLSVTPVSGFNQATNLSCSVSPVVSQGPACSLAPTSVTPNGSTAATATVTVTTAARTSSSAGISERTVLPDSRLWAALFCLPAFVCVFVGAPRRRSGSRQRAWVGIGVVLSFALLSLGCGGGNSSSGAQSGTPAGTYTLTVTGTSGSLTHTINVTLKVN